MKKEPKDAGAEPDEFDDIVAANTGKSLASRLGNSPDMIAKKSKAKKSVDGLKQTKIPFKKVCSVVFVLILLAWMMIQTHAPMFSRAVTHFTLPHIPIDESKEEENELVR